MSKFRVIYVTTGRVNQGGSLYYPPLVANQIRSLESFGVDSKVIIISSIKPFFLIRKIMELRRIRNKYDIIHAQYGSLTAFIACLGSGNKPMLISFGGSDLIGSAGKGLKWKIRNWITRQLGIVAAINCDKVIVKSEYLFQCLPWQIQKKTSIIPNGVDIHTFYPRDKTELREKLKWKLEAYYILFTPSRANNVIVKNLALAKEVFYLVNSQYPETRFELILDKTPEEVAEMMCAADCLLLTSKHEGSPNIIKEAMACNLPIVSVNVGDVGQRLSSVVNSFVVNTYDAKILASKVVDILLKNKRTNGLTELERQHLTSQEVANKISVIYKDMINHAG